MAIWLGLAKLALSLLDGIMGYLRNQQLLSAGQAQAVAKGLTEAANALEEARKDRDAMRRDPAIRDELRDKYR